MREWKARIDGWRARQCLNFRTNDTTIKPQQAIDRALGAMRQISQPDGWVSISYRLDYPDWWAGSPEASKKATETMRSRASAYALYVLAKGGKGDLARLRWWHDVQMKSEASPLAKAQVGAGLALMGDKARARSAIFMRR